LALIFAAEASAIVLIGRNKNALLETKAIIGEKSDSSIYVVVEDLGTPDGPMNCFRKVNDLGLSVDVLANNAGIGFSNKFLSRTLIEYQTLIQTNISALIAMTHLFLPDMVTRGSGVIKTRARYWVRFRCRFLPFTAQVRHLY
jgi:short-subunit dehydrogenase